ncbi:DUF3617 domain-containing protein [Caulobacter sp. KR2-114]|uniref:DUF3617 domain-containing protein n=1 Tax=Caulobacter sp. KR2-114 TaxID=3400912 RepID=UPI003C05FC2F
MNGLRLAGLAAVSVSLIALGACSKGGASSGASQAAGGGSGGGAASPASGPDTVITEADLPRLKAGKWQKVETGDDGKSSTDTYCESGRQLQMKRADLKSCSQFEIKRTFLGGIVMNMTCGNPQYTMTAHATASGDFNSHMTSDVQMTMAVQGKPPVVTKVHTEATYLGPCDAGQKPDDAG